MVEKCGGLGASPSRCLSHYHRPIPSAQRHPELDDRRGGGSRRSTGRALVLDFVRRAGLASHHLNSYPSCSRRSACSLGLVRPAATPIVKFTSLLNAVFKLSPAYCWVTPGSSVKPRQLSPRPPYSSAPSFTLRTLHGSALFRSTR